VKVLLTRKCGFGGHHILENFEKVDNTQRTDKMKRKWKRTMRWHALSDALPDGLSLNHRRGSWGYQPCHTKTMIFPLLLTTTEQAIRFQLKLLRTSADPDAHRF